MDFRGHRHLGVQHRGGPDGRRVRYLPPSPGDGYVRHGGVFPLCDQGLRRDAVHGLGSPVPHHCVAAVPGVRRAHHRGGESLAASAAQRPVRPAGGRRPAHLYHRFGHRQGPLHRPAGRVHGRGGLHFRRGGGGTEERRHHRRVHGDHCGAHPDPHPAHRPGVELLQTPVGDRGAVHRGGGAVLYQPPGLRPGRLQGYQPGVQVLVQDGGLPAAAFGDERLVPPGL